MAQGGWQDALREPPMAELRRSASDMVYDLLHARILSLELPPGSRLSEAEVAAETGVSRQPVRDAFYRLSRQGFLTIRPQVATTVSPISAAKVSEAQFLRTAIELEILRAVCARVSPADIKGLRENLERQEAALVPADPAGFHRLDEAFHRDLAAIAGQQHAWEMIRELKAHMDRVRFLTLTWSAPSAYAEHRALLAAIELGDTAAAGDVMRGHLSRITEHLGKVRAENGPLFGEDDG